MRKNYEEIVVFILTVTDDVVRCSNEFSFGDETEKDPFTKG